MRIHELAKDLEVTSKELIELCRKNGIDVKNHMSGIDDDSVAVLRNAVSGPKGRETAAASAKEPEKVPAVEKKHEPSEKTRPEKKPAPSVPAGAAPEAKKEPPRKPGPQAAPVEVQSGCTVKELAQALDIKVNDLIAKLMGLGVFATITQSLEQDEIELVAAEFGREVLLKREEKKEEEEAPDEEPSRPEDLVPRAPVVTFLGHVDHGKTSLLDSIRQTNVAEGESGGITQHIGAYAAETKGRKVVFVDTPGHEAFTAMRARGANVTDVVVLVVAADDGVMPQTEEAIDHAKAAGVPVMVAINKTDLPSANIQKVKQQLQVAGLTPEDWGGETIMVEVSAKTGKNIDELLEMLALQTDILELKADPTKPARGTILETERSAKKGILAHAIVEQGTLKRGDSVLCGNTYGRVRSIRDHTGHDIKEAGPATPVQLIGLQDPPEAGDHFRVVSDIQKARTEAGNRKKIRRSENLNKRKHVNLENLYASISEGQLKELKLIIKADTHGSIEALESALSQVKHSEVRMAVLHKGVGGINESDILLADASDAIIIGFHVVTTPLASVLAEEKGVDIETFAIIYEAVDSIKSALEGMLDPEEKEVLAGRLTVRATFKISRVGTIAGCIADNGTILRKDRIRVVRNGIVIYTGNMASLKRFKDDVSQVQSGYECGIRVAGFDDIKVGDNLETFRVEKIAKKL